MKGHNRDSRRRGKVKKEGQARETKREKETCIQTFDLDPTFPPRRGEKGQSPKAQKGREAGRGEETQR
jgi:hypothetical protein